MYIVIDRNEVNTEVLVRVLCNKYSLIDIVPNIQAFINDGTVPEPQSFSAI